MEDQFTGQCLCGAVKFSLAVNFKAFYQCHCKQCQQLTGSAFASNIISEPTNINWFDGHDKVSHYEHPTREFSKAFCQDCGSALPFVNKSKTSLVIPAGSLDELPKIEVQANIFTKEQACWLTKGFSAKHFDGFES